MNLLGVVIASAIGHILGMLIAAHADMWLQERFKDE